MDAAHPSVVFYLVERVGPCIEDLDNIATRRDPTDESSGPWPYAGLSLNALILKRQGVTGCPSVFAIVKTVDGCLIGSA